MLKGSYLALLEVLKTLNSSGDSLINIPKSVGAVPPLVHSKADSTELLIFLFQLA